MIEFVTVHRMHSTFSAHYLGVVASADYAYKRNDSTLADLPAFEDLLRREGFTVADTAFRGNLVSWRRERAGLGAGVVV
jgi:hypothetical protein